MAKARRQIGHVVHSRIERDIAEGVLPSVTDAQSLTDLVIAVIQGMSALAPDSFPRTRLLALVAQAMKAFP